jgi:hypothetical protein
MLANGSLANVFVAVLVALAALALVRAIWRSAKGKGGCNCGQCSDKDACDKPPPKQT